MVQTAGYTDQRITPEAVARGWAPILAGRHAKPIMALAKRLRCGHRVFSRDNPREIRERLKGVHSGD